MKRISKIIAGALLSGLVITLAGCAKTVPDSRVATGANWNVRTATKVENNSLDYWRANKEVASYSVTHYELSDDKKNPAYAMHYDTESALYTTEFYAEEYDWGNQKIPADEGYGTADFKEIVYVYETHLTLSGTCMLNGYDGKYVQAFSNVVDTVCKYRLAGDNLQPVYSYQHVKNTSPKALSVRVNADLPVETVMNEVCVTVDADYETFYNRDFTEAKTYTVSRNDSVEDGNGIPVNIPLATKEGYSVFDAAQLRGAMRALSLNQQNSLTFCVLVPQSGVLQSCTASVAPQQKLVVSSEPNSEYNRIYNALTGNKDYIYFDGLTVDGEMRLPRYSSVALSIDAKLKGPSTVQWYAAVEDPELNTTRSVMLLVVDELPFSLGTVSYALKSLEVKPV